MGLYARVFLLRLHLRGCKFLECAGWQDSDASAVPPWVARTCCSFPSAPAVAQDASIRLGSFLVRRNSWPGRLKFVVLATRKCPPQMKLNVSLLAVYFRNTYRASCALRSSSNSLAWTATPCTRTLGCGTGHWPWLREARTRATPSTPSGRPHPGKPARLNARHQKPWAWCQYSTG